MLIETTFTKIFTNNTVRSVTDYLDKDLTVKITRVFKPKKNQRQQEFRITIGKPNYEAKQYLKNNPKFRGLRYKYYK